MQSGRGILALFLTNFLEMKYFLTIKSWNRSNADFWNEAIKENLRAITLRNPFILFVAIPPKKGRRLCNLFLDRSLRAT